MKQNQVNFTVTAEEKKQIEKLAEACGLSQGEYLRQPCFIAQGGDTYYCFAEAANESYRGIGYVDYQAIRHFLKDELGGTVPDKYAEPQGRITEK